jgi:hypothetical protein
MEKYEIDNLSLNDEFFDIKRSGNIPDMEFAESLRFAMLITEGKSKEEAYNIAFCLGCDRYFFQKIQLHEEIMLLKNELLGQTREMNTTGHDDMIDCLANFNDDSFVMPPIDYGEANPKEYEGYYQKSANNFSVF